MGTVSMVTAGPGLKFRSAKDGIDHRPNSIDDSGQVENNLPLAGGALSS